MDENKKNISYNGIIIFLTIFAMIAVTTTTVFSNIYVAKKSNTSHLLVSGDKNKEIENEKSEIEEVIDDVEITEIDTTYVLNLDEFYTTNNLKIEEIDFISGEIVMNSPYEHSRKYAENINYIKIDGLKDEGLENKINADLKSRAFSILNHKDADKFKIAQVFTNVEGNFSNILSIRMTSYLYNKDYNEDDCIRKSEYLNYNLTNGEQIELKEIFCEGISIKDIFVENLYSDYFADTYLDREGYDKYFIKETGKSFMDYDFETREEKIKNLGLMTYDEWLDWEYRSIAEEKVLKTLLDMKNTKLEFLLSEHYLILKTLNESDGHYIENRSIFDKITFYKKFVTEESIFTNEYQLSKEEMCGWPTEEYEKIYYPIENMLIIENIVRNQYLDEEILRLAEEKIDADIQYAKANEEKFFIARVNVYNETWYYDKLEISMKDYLKNKNKILSSISRSVVDGFVEKTILEETESDFLFYDSAYDYGDVYSYLLESDKKILSNDEINTLDIEKLNLAYNEIFARYGHDFVDDELRAYFGTKIWYKPIAGKKATLEELSDIEKQNLELIKNRIAQIKSVN